MSERTEPELLNERLDRLATVLDEIMPNCALLVRDALALLKEQQEQIDKLIEESASNAEMEEGLKELLKEQEARIQKYEYIFDFLGIGFRQWATKILDGKAEVICETDEHEYKTVVTFKLI